MNKHWREVRAFNDLLIWVEETHRLALNGLAPKDQNLRGLTDEFLTAQGLYPVNERGLERLLPNPNQPTTDLFEKKTFFMLKQIDAGVRIQPAMTMSGDFRFLERKPKSKTQTPSPHVRIKIALGFMAGNEFRVIGYRFETPEGIYDASGSAGKGTHDFFHAQPIVVFKKGGRPLDSLFIEGEYPDKQPSFPLAAEGLVTFGLSIFVTLYGRDFLSDVASENVLPSEARESLEFLGQHAYPKVGCCLRA
jgi:hypothetical protein